MYLPYKLLSPQRQRPLEVSVNPPLGELEYYRDQAAVAVDFETRGLDPYENDNNCIVGVGISDGRRATYFDYNIHTREVILDFLYQMPLIMHNAPFDGSWIYAESGRMPTIRMCTLAAFKLLATEGWTGQSHSLKTAMTSVLGWEEPNNIDLNNWLKERGLGSGDMWQAPAEILGPYCALDAGATFHLYEYFGELMEEFPALSDYLNNEVNNLIELVIEQQSVGFHVDFDALKTYSAELARSVQAKEDDILRMPEIETFIKDYNKQVFAAHLVKMPPEFTKTGKRSVRWENWKHKADEVASTQHFNIRSTKHKQWLFFDQMGLTPVKMTDTGQPSVDKDSLPHFGPVGRAMADYNKLNKELGYVRAALGQVRSDGAIHPRLKVPGTVTGRLAGDAGFNLQQQPKTPGYLKCLQARPDHSWIQMDFDALEPKVQTMFSRDESLLSIYGPDAEANDIYLYNGAHMNVAGIAEEIKKYYDPYAPTPESISLAKTHCKPIRYMCKVFTLAASYKAWVKKLHQVLINAGFDVTFEQVHVMYNDYWDLYSGLREFDERLKYEWKTNGGWIYNARGRPLGVDDKFTKDLLNRFVQSTGHDVLLAYLLIFNRRRRESGIQTWPAIVDFHDETIWESRTEDAPAVAELMRDSMKELNETLGWDIQMTGEPEIIENLAQCKCEDYNAI